MIKAFIFAAKSQVKGLESLQRCFKTQCIDAHHYLSQLYTTSMHVRVRCTYNYFQLKIVQERSVLVCFAKSIRNKYHPLFIIIYRIHCRYSSFIYMSILYSYVYIHRYIYIHTQIKIKNIRKARRIRISSDTYVVSVSAIPRNCHSPDKFQVFQMNIKT